MQYSSEFPHNFFSDVEKSNSTFNGIFLIPFLIPGLPIFGADVACWGSQCWCWYSGKEKIGKKKRGQVQNRMVACLHRLCRWPWEQLRKDEWERWGMSCSLKEKTRTRDNTSRLSSPAALYSGTLSNSLGKYREVLHVSSNTQVPIINDQRCWCKTKQSFFSKQRCLHSCILGCKATFIWFFWLRCVLWLLHSLWKY